MRRPASSNTEAPATEPFDLATVFGPVPASARDLAARSDPAVAAAWVADMCMAAVFPDYTEEPLFREALARSALDNIDEIWRIIAGRSELGAVAPPSGFAFAEAAAEIGVPAGQFERLYRVGAGLTWVAWYRVAKAHAEAGGAPLSELLETPTAIIHGYLDSSSAPALERHGATLAEMRRTRDQLQRTVLRRALAGTPITDEYEAARALGVNLGGEYMAFAARCDRLDSSTLLEPAKRAAEAGTVIIHQQGPGLWLVWLWRHDRFGPERTRKLADALARGGHPVALSDRSIGIQGVGVTGRDALETARLQRLTGETGLLAYVDVRIETMLLRDRDEAARFVASELGELAGPGDRLTTLRETAMQWLSCGSHVTAAVHLGVHEHTVRNRVTQIEQLLGHGMADRRTELLVALRLLRMLESTATSGTAIGPAPSIRKRPAGRDAAAAEQGASS